MELQSSPNEDQTQDQAQYWNGPEAGHASLGQALRYPQIDG
jgi:hypothetical protein